MHHPVALARSVLVAAVAACALVIPSTGRAAEPAGGAEALMKQIGSPRGVVVLLEDTQCQRALALAKASELVIYVQLSDPADATAACGAGA